MGLFLLLLGQVGFIGPVKLLSYYPGRLRGADASRLRPGPMPESNVTDYLRLDGRREVKTGARFGFRLFGFLILWLGISAVLMPPAIPGPPFLTDDPVPVPFKHWEFYLFSTIDATRKQTDASGPAFEFNLGAFPNL
jgi:hypothetical protein